MVNKTVMSVNMQCYKCKRTALKSVTEIDGIDSIEFNMKDQTVTVVGDADPVCMANLLRRKFPCARLISHGPPPPPQQAKPKDTDKPKEEAKPKDKKDKPKEEAKGGDGSAQNANKKPAKNADKPEKTQDMAPIVLYQSYGYPSAYPAPPPHCCCGYSPCSCRSEIGVYVLNEEPPACTIC